MDNETKVSVIISDFVKFLNDANFSYTYMLEKMSEQEKITQDILHSLELDDLKYSERAKLATKLATARKQRRIYKDAVEELAPVADFLEDNKKLLNNFSALVGSVRKQERYHSNRQYYPRIVEKDHVG